MPASACRSDTQPGTACRIDIVAASIAANVHPPIASVNPNFADPDTLREETRHFRNMGYVSRPAIHPAQIETINDALKPSPTEVMDAKDLLARHEAALADDRGAHGQAGQMIDEASYGGPDGRSPGTTSLNSDDESR